MYQFISGCMTFSQFALTTNCYGTIENIATLLNLVAMPANYSYMAAFDLCITRLSVAYSNGFRFKWFHHLSLHLIFGVKNSQWIPARCVWFLMPNWNGAKIWRGSINRSHWRWLSWVIQCYTRVGKPGWILQISLVKTRVTNFSYSPQIGNPLTTLIIYQ